MKAALVIDLPPVDDLGNIEVEYNISYIGESQSWEESGVGKLRPLPREWTMDEVEPCAYNEGFVDGLNHCIYLITGETE